MVGLAKRGLAEKGLARLGLGAYGLSGAAYEGVLVPPYYSELVQLMKNGVETGTDNEVADVISPLIVTDRADYVGNACLELDGVADRIVAGGICAGDHERIECIFHNDILWDGTGSIYSLMADYNNQVRYFAAGAVTGSAVGETLTIVTDGDIEGNGFAYITDAIPIGWHTLVAQWDGDQYQFSIDGIAKTTLTVGNPAIANGWRPVIGSRRLTAGSYNLFFDGKMSHFKIDDSLEYTFAETTDDFTLSTCYDASGNSNDGTISTGAGGLATVRSTSSDIPPWNIVNGFTEVIV